jgi:hypothetical protein
MFSGLRMYFFCVILRFSNSSSVPVDFLFFFVVYGVMFGVVSVLSLLFCSSICCLCGDLSDSLVFDHAMFVD